MSHETLADRALQCVLSMVDVPGVWDAFYRADGVPTVLGLLQQHMYSCSLLARCACVSPRPHFRSCR